MEIRAQRMIGFRSGALVTVVIAVLMGVMAIAAFSWAVDTLAGTSETPKAERLVAVEIHDPIMVVLADGDPRSHVPAKLMDQMAAR